VEARVARQIASIPGHAKYPGDEIEKLSNKFGTTPDRACKIDLLRRVRSKEVLEELGHLLFDSRLPEATIPLEKLDLELPIQANDGIAAGKLHIFLGKDSPLKVSPARLSNGKEQMQQWWNSEAGLAYRAAFVGASKSDPQPSPGRSTIVLPMPTPAIAVASTITHRVAKERRSHWLWIVIGFSLLAFAVLIWKRYSHERH